MGGILFAIFFFCVFFSCKFALKKITVFINEMFNKKDQGNEQ